MRNPAGIDGVGSYTRREATNYRFGFLFRFDSDFFSVEWLSGIGPVGFSQGVAVPGRLPRRKQAAPIPPHGRRTDLHWPWRRPCNGHAATLPRCRGPCGWPASVVNVGSILGEPVDSTRMSGLESDGPRRVGVLVIASFFPPCTPRRPPLAKIGQPDQKSHPKAGKKQSPADPLRNQSLHPKRQHGDCKTPCYYEPPQSRFSECHTPMIPDFANPTAVCSPRPDAGDWILGDYRRSDG